MRAQPDNDINSCVEEVYHAHEFASKPAFVSVRECVIDRASSSLKAVPSSSLPKAQSPAKFSEIDLPAEDALWSKNVSMSLFSNSSAPWK